MSRDVVNTAEFAPMSDQMGFSQGVKAAGLLFCSGAIGADMTEQGPVVPDDIETEYRLAFQSLKDLLAVEGLTFADVVEMTTYHVEDSKHPDAQQKLFPVYQDFVSAPYPAWTAVGIAALAVPGAHIEIRIIAKLK